MTPLPAVRRPGGTGRGAAASDQLLCDETGNPFALLRCGCGGTTDHEGGDWEYAIVEDEILIGGVAHDSREWQPDGEGGVQRHPRAVPAAVATGESRGWGVPFIVIDDDSPRYRDYLGSGKSEPSPIRSARALSTPRIIININRHNKTWSAVLKSGEGLPGEFDSGTREEAISWARYRCDVILIFSSEHRDLVPLDEA